MLFRVENLGPLREAEVDLSKRLIVLTGPNNTGKTYLAWTVYGLHRYAPHASDVLARWARALVTSPSHAIDVEAMLEADAQRFGESVTSRFRTQLDACFAAQKGHFAPAQIALTATPADYDLSHFFPMNTVVNGTGDHRRRYVFMPIRTVSPGRLELRLTISDETSGSDGEGNATPAVAPAPAADEQSRVEHAFQQSLAYVSVALHKGLLPRCTIFPAERTAVNLFATEFALRRVELVDEMLSGAPGQDDDMELPRRAGRYPWPIGHSLHTANDLPAASKSKGPFAYLADELEQTILGGRVGVSGYGEMLFTPSAAPEQQLGVNLTAAVVKSLASLVFYFRHAARKGDFLIIDEPELNLHPDNQRKVTQILAKAVRRGFKIMVSTHSDYVIRELNHLVMASQLPPEEVAELGYDPAGALKPEEVGVYLFDKGRATPVPVDETGFSVETIDAEINRMQNVSQRFYAKLSR